MRSQLGEGARAALPLAVAVTGFGVSYGVLARTAGMGTFAPLVMSATTFAGSAQFAAASILERSGGAAAAVVAAVLLNARYLPIGMSVAPAIPGRWPAWRRLAAAQLVVDESWAVGHLGGGRFDLGRLLGAGLLLYGAWFGGTATGLAFGDTVGDPERLGLDAAFPALFIALLWPQLKSRPAFVVAAGGAGIALSLTPFAPAGVPVVLAAAVSLAGLRNGR